MQIFNRLRGLFRNNAAAGPPVNFNFGGLAGGGELGSDMSEITYFTCLKKLSESLGKLPLYLMTDDKQRITDHDTTLLFHKQPNPNCTPIQFWTYMEYCRNHYGNAYAFIETDQAGKFVALWPLDPMGVTLWVNNTELFAERRYFYQYRDVKTGKTYWLEPGQVLHVKSWLTVDCLVGKSVREILASNMQGAKASQRVLNDLYQKGLTANAVIKYVGDLSGSKQELLLRRVEEQARTNGRRMITLPLGFDIQTLDLKLTDSQFYELKKYNALQVAAAFGVPPNTLNDYSKSSYANSSAQNLGFYVDTLLYNVTLYEQELNRKLLTTKEIREGKNFKFNVKVILRADPAQQAQIMTALINSSVYSPNDARRQLDMPPTDGGNVHIVNGAYVKLTDIGKAYDKGVK